MYHTSEDAFTKPIMACRLILMSVDILPEIYIKVNFTFGVIKWNKQ